MIRWIAPRVHRLPLAKRHNGRRVSGRLAATLLALGIAASPAIAGTPATLGDLRFEAPEPGSGWVPKPVKGGMLYQKEFPPNADMRRKGAAIIEVLGPVAGAPDTLDRGFESFVRTVKGLDKVRPMSKAAGTTANGHRVRTDYRCCAMVQGMSVGQRTVGIASGGGRQVFLALVGMQLRGPASKSAEADFAALARSVVPEAGDKPFALVPHPGDGGLDGVYTHLSTGLRPNAFGGMDFHSDSEIAVFDPSGLYSTELPETGDIATHCRAMPTDCGLYALKGGGFLSGAGEIEMRAVADAFGTIETETKPFARKGDDLSIDAGAYNRIPPFPAGTSFEGTWRFFFAAVGSTAFSSNSVSSERRLTFSRDGTFRRDGWTGASGSTDTGTGTAGFATGPNRRPATGGRYKVEGYALEMTGDDGGTERLSIFAPDKSSDKLLVIGGSNYLKQE